MKKQLTRAFTLFSLLVMSAVFTPLSAQTSRMIVVHVPFEFVAGNKRLPAGDYTVRRIVRDSEKTLMIRGADGSATVTVMTSAVEAGKEVDKAKLDFTRYGEQYFLAQVWTPGSATGRALVKSRLQKSLERELSERRKAGVEAAQQSVEGSTVTIIGGVR